MTDLNRYLDLYLSHLKVERGLSRNTLEAYSRDLGRFATHVEKRQLTLTAIDHQTVQSFITSLSREGLGSRTQARTLSTLRGFFKFAADNQYRTDNPAADVEMPKTGRSLPVYLTLEEIEVLLNAPDRETPRGLRDATMLHTMYASGARVSRRAGTTG